ncbi:unnamed protein product [Adineta ricciae]|uniref:Protein-S-isoprenylcysteine O-methyltransferase n=1 Tax=Adineta ricciae TaxID=249248 RepID=A0A814VF48_ADIRI|nr:unnamed protein product [Adineta ricciae]
MFILLQLFLLLLTSLLYYKGSTNPNLSSHDDYTPSEGLGSKYAVKLMPRIGQLFVWSSTLYQSLYLFLQAFSPTAITMFFPQASTSAHLLSLTSISMVGYLLMIVGGLGRLWCYRTLGRFFTFEITIRNSHKLIKTGPYTYVRHPSYTFAFMLTTGMFLVHRRIANFFPDTYRLKGFMLSPVGVVTFCVVFYLLLLKRVTTEEKALAKAFGKEWNEYTSKTKRFIPTIM